MEVEILRKGEVAFEAIPRGHRASCDQPATNGGSASRMMPPEFLSVSLGARAGFYVFLYLEARSLPADGLRIKVKAEEAMPPARLRRFQIEVTAAELDPHHDPGILRAVKPSLIHNTLLNAPAIDIVLNAPVEMPDA